MKIIAFFLIHMAIWCAGCALNDYVLNLGGPWLMLYGWVVGTTSLGVSAYISGITNKSTKVLIKLR